MTLALTSSGEKDVKFEKFTDRQGKKFTDRKGRWTDGQKDDMLSKLLTGELK